MIKKIDLLRYMKIDLKHGVDLYLINCHSKLLINIKEMEGSSWYIVYRDIG